MLAAILLGLSLFAWQQWQRVETELQIAMAQNLAAQAHVAYLATPGSDVLGTASPERGVLLALESLNFHPTVEGDHALRRGLHKLPGQPLEVQLESGVGLAGIGPDGNWLLLQNENDVQRHDIATGSSRLASLDERQLASQALAAETAASDTMLAHSPDGRFELVYSDEGVGDWIFASTAIHRTSDGKRLSLLPHEWFVRFAAFSADNRWLLTVTATASLDAAEPAATAVVGSTVRVWEVPSGRKVTEVSLAREGGISRLALSPDGGWLAISLAKSEGHTVHLWPLWPDLLRAAACDRLTRNLSPSEWTTFIWVKPWQETCPGLPVVSE